MNDRRMMQASLSYVEALLEKILPSVDSLEQVSFSFFVRTFFQRLSLDAVQEFSDDTWKNLLLQAWEFYKKCPGGAKSQCFLEDIHAIQGPFQRTALLVMNPNVPFLVDSLQHALSQEGLGVILLAHPVFLAKRDSRGRLLKVDSVKSGLTGGAEESLIFCLLNEALTPSETLELAEKIQKLFEKVTCVVGDWPAMRAKAQDIARSITSDDGDLGEIRAFFQWIDQGHFTFLGYSKYSVSSEGELEVDAASTSLGLLRETYRTSLPLFFEGAPQTDVVAQILTDPETLFLLTKTSRKSPVLRPEFMDAVGFKILDSSGRVIGLHHFLGLFTARAYTQSARDIPLVRLKVRDVLEKSGLDPAWHDGKRLIHLLETLPRDELFQTTTDDLATLGALGLEFQPKGPVRLFVRFDSFGRYVSCFIYVPRDHYRAGLRYQMGELLATFFDGTLVTSHVHLESLPFAWIHCLIHLSQPFSKDLSIPYLDQQLTALSLTWEDRLRMAWVRAFGEKKGLSLYSQSRLAFPRSYAEYCTPEEATQDFKKIQESLARKELYLSLVVASEEKNQISLKIYSPESPLPLSDMIPALENMGLKVLTEIPFKIQLSPDVFGWVHLIQAQAPQVDLGTQIRDFFEETFKKVWTKETENDAMNRLVLTAGLNWRECLLFRAYTKYLKQLQIPYSQAYVEEVLLKHADVVRGFLRLFHLRFDPLFAHQRLVLQEQELASLRELLMAVTHHNEERVLRYLLNLILSTLRTNFYQKTQEGACKAYLSFKLDCHKIEGLPLPLPLYEIFVYSSRIEGVHLRGGKVSRGGLRWSDRPEDYRTEILDLMKTQMVKNSVTVPVGSKGGFIVKKTDSVSPQEWQEEGIACYKIFIRGLLDLTDNRVGEEIVTPPDIVPWDDADPYLVVAADKGTAARSNDANELAREYKFWLGDAFASGGSHGYNHKKMAITSRGAWKSVEHHFKEIGLDPEVTPFTVVGIGDMSGDIFGNGMLLSRQIQLVGAFDHRHIFLDPQPDLALSYQERQRLFALPTSSWLDYDKTLLSPGGGVFSRDLGAIPLSPEVRERLGLEAESLSPEALIRALLRAPVDLLWFGGIGTFVKASFESDADVGDKTNDLLRVNGREMRARVVVEGGNLGLTQRGRIEYALAGGRINTDALDNSAGVDCSDHEVNLKLLFQGLLQRHEMTFERRNELLIDMTDEVAVLVLADNYWQNQAVALAYSKGVQLLEEHGHLMRSLEQQGKLDRDLEALPTDEALQQRKALKLGLTRPELCVLLAYSKIDLYQTLLESPELNDPLFERVLFKYFPRIVRQKFAEACEAHPLKQEIVATLVTNIIVNTLGPSFVNEVCEVTGARPDLVVKAMWVTRKILKLGELEGFYLKLTTPALQQQVLWFMDQVVKRLVIWFLRQENMRDSIEDIVNRYQAGFDELRETILNFLPKNYLEPLRQSLALFFETEMSQRLGQALLAFEPLSFAPDMIQVSISLKKPVTHVARLYYALGELLGLRCMREVTHEFPMDAPWHQKAFREIREQMLLIQQQLTLYILSTYTVKRFDENTLLELWQEDVPEMLGRYLSILTEIQKNPLIDFAPFVVLGRELERLYEKTAGMCMMTVSY